MIVRSFVNDTSVLATACSQVHIGDVVYQLEEDVQIAFIGRPLESIRLIDRAAMLLPKPEPEYMRYRSLGRVSEGVRYKLDEVPEGVTVFGFYPLDLVELAYQTGWKVEEKLGSPVQDLGLAGSIVEQDPHGPRCNFTLPSPKNRMITSELGLIASPGILGTSPEVCL